MKLVLLQKANSVQEIYINPESIISIENIYKFGQNGEEAFYIRLMYTDDISGYYLNKENGLLLINSCTLIAKHK